MAMAVQYSMVSASLHNRHFTSVYFTRLAVFLLLNYNPSNSVIFVDVQHRLNMLSEAEMMIKCLCFWKAAKLKQESLKENMMFTGRAQERRCNAPPYKYRLE